MAIKVNEKGPGAALVLDYMPFTQGGGGGALPYMCGTKRVGLFGPFWSERPDTGSEILANKSEKGYHLKDIFSALKNGYKVYY